MEGFSVITYKNKQIFYIDYSGIGSTKEKVLEFLDWVAVEYKKSPPKSILALTNIENLHFDSQIIEAFKKGRNQTMPYEKRVAVIGMKGIQKVAYNFIVSLTQKDLVKAFDSEIEAKEWLVKD